MSVFVWLSFVSLGVLSAFLARRDELEWTACGRKGAQLKKIHMKCTNSIDDMSSI